MPVTRSLAALIAFLLFAVSAGGQAVSYSGFALLRGTAEEGSSDDPLSSQVQLGVDWLPSPRLGAHVGLLARTESEGKRDVAGIVEAYLDVNLQRNDDRLRLRGGAFFIPSSRENVDELWENPYAITTSALNSWLGEELRPIGIDALYGRQRLFAGATIFRGNDTLGSLPAVRGWTRDDHWTLLGEWVPADPEYFTSVSAENDGRLGWSARAGWRGDHLYAQLIHIDNRADGLEYGHLFNWGTRFDIASAEYTLNDWTFAAEAGWGPSFLDVEGERFVSDLEAGYVMASRRWARSRATIRLEAYAVDEHRDEAITVAWFWTGIPKVRLGAEISSSGGDQKALVDVRYHFSGR
jgi:hypothetical protein